MKKQIILALGLLLIGTLQAQETGSYISFDVGGGFHNLSYKLQDGTEQGKMGYTLNAGYSYFFNPKWGVHTGLGLQAYNSRSTLNFLSATPDVDIQGQAYVFKANYVNWQEKQHSIQLDIPLELQFRQPLTPKIKLLTSVGGMISFPVNTGFETAGGKFVTTGYYSVWNVEMSDMPQHGFSTMTNSFTGKTTLKPAFLAIGDIGGLFKMSEKIDLYVGGYINYGLNNVLNPDTKLIYDPSKVYNGMFASSQTSSVTPIAIGVKLGLYLHLGESKPIIDVTEGIPATQPVAAVVPVQPVPPVPVPEPVVPVPPVSSEVVDVNARRVADAPKEAQKEAPKEMPKDVAAEPTVKTITPVDAAPKDDSFADATKIAESMNVMFGFNSAVVTSSKNQLIKELSDILKLNPSLHILFVGHTCNIGTHKVNKRLGMRRAKNVKRKFIKHAVSRSQLKAKSMAYDQPLVPNTSKQNRARNRRVEIKVIKFD